MELFLGDELKNISSKIDGIAQITYAADMATINKRIDWATLSDERKEPHRNLVRSVLESKDPLKAAYRWDQSFWEKEKHPLSAKNKYLMPLDEWVNTQLGRQCIMLMNIVLALAHGTVAKQEAKPLSDYESAQQCGTMQVDTKGDFDRFVGKKEPAPQEESYDGMACEAGEPIQAGGRIIQVVVEKQENKYEAAKEFIQKLFENEDDPEANYLNEIMQAGVNALEENGQADFKPGDVVALKSGSPNMTILRIDKDIPASAGSTILINYAVVGYTDHGVFKREQLPLISIQKVNKFSASNQTAQVG